MSASQSPTARATTAQTARRATAATAQAPVAAREQELLLDRYRLKRRLGAGAFGTVWLARDERLERDVAVKVVPRERIVGGRFEREARTAARLSHPGIVTLFEATVDDDGAYLVSEAVRGATLDRLLADGRLSDQDILMVAIALCDALEHAHGQGIVHRDVKPSNILIPDRPSGSADAAKLTDFGVAHVIGGDSLTRTGDVVGTAAYMAPEQAEGREVGPASDLYALALVTYEALTGVNPVRTTTAAPRSRRLGVTLPPLRRQRRDLPRELGRAIDLALRPRARERGTVAELRAALVASLPEVGDTPGIVADSWARTMTHRATQGDADAEGEPFAAPADRAGEQASLPQTEPAAPEPWPARALAATGAAATTGWLAGHLLSPLPLTPIALAVLAWLVVLLLPRIGWMTLALALAVTASAQGHAAGAVVVLIAMLVPVALMPRAGVVWPLSAGAPALGLIGLAGAWPALAGRLPGSAWRRGGLAACGYVWLVLAAPFVGHALYMARPAGTPAPDVWTGSLSVTFRDVLGPVISSGILVGAVVWAAAAVVLPWLLRGRSLALDVVIVTVWSAVVVSVTEEVTAAVARGHVHPAPASAVAGAVAGGLLALAPALIGAWRTAAHRGSPLSELP